MPSLTAKMKSSCSESSPHLAEIAALPARRTGGPRKESSLFLRTLPRSVHPRPAQALGAGALTARIHSGHASALGENRGELEIDQAEAPIRIAIGDVAHLGIVVAHAIRASSSSKSSRSPLLIEMLDPAAAIRRHDHQFIRIASSKRGHKWAAACLQMAEHADFIGKSFLRFGPAKSLDVPGHRNVDAHRRPRECLLHRCMPAKHARQSRRRTATLAE